MKTYKENLSFLIEFIHDNQNKKIHQINLPDMELCDYLSHDSEFIGNIINAAGDLNKRIHSDLISIAIEEIASVMEVK